MVRTTIRKISLFVSIIFAFSGSSPVFASFGHFNAIREQESSIPKIYYNPSSNDSIANDLWFDIEKGSNSIRGFIDW